MDLNQDKGKLRGEGERLDKGFAGLPHVADLDFGLLSEISTSVPPKIFYFVCCLHVCMCSTCMPGAYRGQTSVME